MFLKNKKLSNSSSFQIILHITLLVVLVVAYFPVLKHLFFVWINSGEYSHGFIIIPISAYIIWRKRDHIKKIEPSPSWMGLLVLLVVLAIYVLSSLMRIATIASVTFPLCMAAMVVYFYGYNVLREVLFPLAFLLLMIPIPEQIYSAVTIQLQLLVSKLSFTIASTVGVPIFREGNVIHLPTRTLQVVEACSGIRSLISLLTLCLVVGYFGLKSNMFRTIIAIGSIPIAVMVNVIRVLLMIAALHYFQFDLTEEPVHTILGMVIFSIALGVTLFLFKGLELWEK